MNSADFSQLSKQEVLQRLESNIQQGLTDSQAAKRLDKFGKNQIEKRHQTWVKILLRQLKSPFIYLLFAAAVIALIIGEQIDSLIILLFILLNTILGFFQEFKAEKTFNLLQSYITSYAKVIRNGKIEQIVSNMIVPGDIVLLETGDKIPADMRILELNNLSIDESVLTGESIPINKTAKQQPGSSDQRLTADNMLYGGSSVVDGTAKCIVAATGKNTSFGKIAQLTINTQQVSGFEETLSRLSSFILKIVLVTLALLFIINLIFRPGAAEISTLLIFSIALAVSVIPQALPLVMTFALSKGAGILAKKKVIVRRLSAIEELGSLSVLCTDKTGTITENKLEFTSVLPSSDPKTLIYANLAASVLEGKGLEPFDTALWDALDDDSRKAMQNYQRIQYIPFNPSQRRNGVLVKLDDENIQIARGAVEAILDKCDLSESEKTEVNAWVDEKGRQGMRCLAIAKKGFASSEEVDVQEDWKNGGFKFIGVTAFEDPIKESTFLAVDKVKELGIELKVITGDSKRVAAAVANEIGLIDGVQQIITGFEFDDLTPDEKTDAAADNIVFARFTPEQKHELVEILKDKHEVGFLGDGINDAPALKMADISMVVSNSSDIAREASDIILLEKDLAVIVDGIKQGRKVFANTVKYLMLTFAANFGNFYAVAIVSLFIDFLPMLPIQILLLNLLTDFPMIAVAGDSVDKEAVSRPRRYNVREILILSTILGLVSTVFDFGFFFVFLGDSPAMLQTGWFLGSVLTELVFIFSIRTKKFFVNASLPSKGLILLSLSAAAITVLLPFLNLGQRYFQFERITVNTLLIVVLITAVYFIATEAAKLVYYRRKA